MWTRRGPWRHRPLREGIHTGGRAFTRRKPMSRIHSGTRGRRLGDRKHGKSSMLRTEGAWDNDTGLLGAGLVVLLVHLGGLAAKINLRVTSN
jgi:hypothetical protein